MNRSITFGVVAATFFSFAACGSPAVQPTPTIVEETVTDGRRLLEAGRFRPAKATFWRVISPDSGLAPNHCEAHYGYVLAVAFEFVGSLMDAGDWGGDDNGNRIGAGSLPLGMAPATVVTPELDAYVSSFVDPADQGFILPMIESLRHVVAGRCEFEIAGGIPLETAATTYVRLGRIFGQSHAQLLLGGLELIHGGIQFATAFDLRIDFDQVLQIINAVFERGGGQNDLILLRALAGPMGDSPNFLGLHPKRGVRLFEARGWLVQGIQRVRDGLDAFFYDPTQTGADRRDAVVGYIDANGDGAVGIGDELWLGVVEAVPKLELFGTRLRSYPIDLVHGELGPVIGAAVFSVVKDETIRRVDHLLSRLSDSMQGRGHLLNLAEFNMLLGGVPLIPQVVALDLSRLLPTSLDAAVPPRAFLPAWGTYDPPNGEWDRFGAGYTAFLFEEELRKGAPLHRYVAETTDVDPAIFCYRCGPGVRFRNDVYGAAATYFSFAPEVAQRLGSTAPTEIPDDCVAPDSGSWTYGWWQDPTFGGVLYLNLAGLDPSDRCANDAPYVGEKYGNEPVPRSAAIPASRYGLNKVISLYLGGSGGILDLF